MRKMCLSIDRSVICAGLEWQEAGGASGARQARAFDARRCSSWGELGRCEPIVPSFEPRRCGEGANWLASPFPFHPSCFDILPSWDGDRRHGFWPERLFGAYPNLPPSQLWARWRALCAVCAGVGACRRALLARRHGLCTFACPCHYVHIVDVTTCTMCVHCITHRPCHYVHIAHVTALRVQCTVHINQVIVHISDVPHHTSFSAPLLII